MNVAELDDEKLVARVCEARDEVAFRALYRRHTPALYGLAIRLMGVADPDVADIVQDAWCRASEALGRFRWNSALRTWLAGFVVNCCRERIRDRIRIRGDHTLPLDWRTAEYPADAKLHLAHAIASLAHGHREVLILHDVEGYTHEEVAAILGIEPGTSKSQLSRARAAMRILLKEKSA